MNIIIVDDYNGISKKAAYIVASQMILSPKSVIGFATGSTPLGTYKELISLYEGGMIDFSEIVSFNLDEYYGLPEDNPESYHSYMKENLFNDVNILWENINIPNGMSESIDKECAHYEKRIEEAGGIDLQILGIGNNGHIGFNEPDEKFEANTHLVQLDKETIHANSRFFSSIDEVPTQAISMGIGSIMKAKKIVLLASGAGKAGAIYNAIKGPITPQVPASILQLHSDVIVILDKEAASML